jgi:ADP-heptose:LPS heptosyltransferase
VTPRKILIVRLDGIGDALVCTPLIDALHEAGHTLGIALSDRNAGLFAPGTAVATHVLERIPWPQHGATPASRARADAEIAAQGYDVALIASEEPDAYDLAAAVPVRVGFTTGWAKPLKSLWLRNRLTHAVLRPASAGRAREHEALVLFRLGADYVDAPPSRDAARLRRWIAGDGPVPQRTGLVVQLGAKWRTAGVGESELRRALSAVRGRSVRALAAPVEIKEQRARFPELTIEAPPTAREWIAALDRAAAVLTVDTGAAHAAGMLGVPVVDVFPDAHFEAQTRRWMPWASPSVVVRASEFARAPETIVAQALDAL